MVSEGSKNVFPFQEMVFEASKSLFRLQKTISEGSKSLFPSPKAFFDPSKPTSPRRYGIIQTSNAFPRRIPTPSPAARELPLHKGERESTYAPPCEGGAARRAEGVKRLRVLLLHPNLRLAVVDEGEVVHVKRTTFATRHIIAILTCATYDNDMSRCFPELFLFIFQRNRE